MVPSNPYWPYPNMSSFLFGDWFWQHENKSRTDCNYLLKDVLLHLDFKLDNLRNVNFKAIDNQMVTSGKGSPIASPTIDGWKKTEVIIDVLIKNLKPALFSIPSLHHRSLVSVIQDVFTNDATAKSSCYQPYQEYWKVPGMDNTEHLHGELYMSDAFNQAHKALQQQPSVDTIPCVICMMMLWSDSTHLMSFRQAKLWPLYLYFGNQLKYE
ncbi:hypothetical protein FRB94_005321 [Tulasnella sp. JGI-2019a]|nr:hypothetical protein FRB94_005321 [Tulasnella sp. JGI-2019a]